MKPTKTHYVTLRVIYDKSCDQKAAVHGVIYGLCHHLRDAIPAQAAGSPLDRTNPMTFRVDRVMSASTRSRK